MEKGIQNIKIQEFSSEKRNRLIIYIVALLIVNIGLLFIINMEGATNLAGQKVGSAAAIRAGIISYIITLPIIGFMLGTIISIFPYQKLSYSKKYLRASLISILIIYIITLIFEIRNLILFC